MSQRYKLPYYELGPRAVLPSEIGDIVDWGLQSVGVPDFWRKTNGRGVRVGVCDTGRPNHIDLHGRIAVSRNFSGSRSESDSLGHSTHVCGIIAAERNGHGIVGVAPECELCVVKVIGDDGTGTETATADGIDFCREQHCDIISLSLAGGVSSLINAAIDRATAAGILLVCAVGNAGRLAAKNTITWPARRPDVLAVGSYNKDGNLSKFSASGAEISFVFPGENILSCWVGNTYRRSSGTSMAAPFCAGLLALLTASRELAGEPKLRTKAEAEQELRKYARDGGVKGRDSQWGWGYLSFNSLAATT